MKTYTRHKLDADGLWFEKVVDTYDAGTVRLKFQLGVDGTKRYHDYHVEAKLSAYQIVDLAEQVAEIMDAQIKRLQATRNRLK